MLPDYNESLPKEICPQRDISREAVWSLSSCKVEGYGINQLLDERTESYWQSDGPQPHMITIEFQKYTEISFLLMYLDFKTDESYTPQKIQVFTGNSILDLDEPPNLTTFDEPTGWKAIDLRKDQQSVRAFVVQVQILQNHQNGRDTHVRACKVLGPIGHQFATEDSKLSRRELVNPPPGGPIFLDRIIR